MTTRHSQLSKTILEHKRNSFMNVEMFKIIYELLQDTNIILHITEM